MLSFLNFTSETIMKNGSCSLFILLIIFALALASCHETTPSTVTETPVVEEPLPPFVGECYGIPRSNYQIDTVKLPANSLLEGFLRSEHVAEHHLRGLGFRIDSIFSVKRFRAGKETYFFRNDDSSVAYWVYRHSPEAYLLVGFTGDSVTVRYDSLSVSHQLSLSHAKVESSLWNAMRESGAQPELALRLSDLFAWSVDFFGLTSGDEFVTVYDKRFVADQEVGLGRIYTAYYIHGKDTLKAYSFEQDSSFSYWDAQGNSLRKAFLKAPLSFTRISSHFSYARMHPILKIVRAHTGVDYAAPMGTPVMALGDGTVIGKGYERGGGNFVKIRHNGVYTTGYLHLSKFAKGIQVGSRVQQSDVIGYVGMTGYATGPHLDFRVWKNGTPVNPLTLDSPSDTPIKEVLRPAFEQAMRQQDSVLRSLQTVRVEVAKNLESRGNEREGE